MAHEADRGVSLKHSLKQNIEKLERSLSSQPNTASYMDVYQNPYSRPQSPGKDSSSGVALTEHSAGSVPNPNSSLSVTHLIAPVATMTTDQAYKDPTNDLRRIDPQQAAQRVLSELSPLTSVCSSADVTYDVDEHGPPPKPERKHGRQQEPKKCNRCRQMRPSQWYAPEPKQGRKLDAPMKSCLPCRIGQVRSEPDTADPYAWAEHQLQTKHSKIQEANEGWDLEGSEYEQSESSRFANL